MRLSCRREDPGYDAEACIKEYEFTCDGKVVECVITIDEEEGFLICFARAEDGELVTETMHGVVKIREV